MLGEIAAIDYVCALSHYREVAYISLGLSASPLHFKIFDDWKIFNARQYKRDNRSGSTGSGKVITHGQIALVD